MKANIEISFMEDKELQKRLEDGLMKRGYIIAKSRSIHASTFTICQINAQDAFWIGCNYVALAHKLYDSGITKTFG